jgi:F-type H+-transporting ATPase subunit epsilon
MDNTEKISCKIISISSLVFECKADMIILPGTDGIFGILPGHSPLIANLRIGVIKISIGTELLQYFIYGGIAEIKNNILQIISEFATNLIDHDKVLLMDKLASYRKDLELETDCNIRELIERNISKYQALVTYC